MSAYMLHMNILQSTMSPQTLVYINFILLAYAPEPTTMHIYVPLHYYCSLHAHPTLLHIEVKKEGINTSMAIYKHAYIHNYIQRLKYMY